MWIAFGGLKTLLAQLLGAHRRGTPSLNGPRQDMQSVLSSEEPLLNFARLESYRRVGLLSDVVTGYLPRMNHLMGALAAAAAALDLQATTEAMHSLLGISGEAGAQALARELRRLYVPLVEFGQWPPGETWVRDLQVLTTRTEAAIESYCAATSSGKSQT